MPLTDRWFQAKHLDPNPEEYPRYGCGGQEMPGRTLVGPHVVDSHERHLKAVERTGGVLQEVSYRFQGNNDDMKGIS